MTEDTDESQELDTEWWNRTHDRTNFTKGDDYVSDMKMTEIEQDFEMDTTAGPDVANKVAKLISETTARGKISE